MHFGIARECKSCGREMAAYQTGCLYCNEDTGFQFPWLHAIGIGVSRMAANANGRLLVRGAGALVAAAGVALALT